VGTILAHPMATSLITVVLYKCFFDICLCVVVCFIYLFIDFNWFTFMFVYLSDSMATS